VRSSPSLLALLLLLSGCASVPSEGPELRYCAQLRTGDVILLSAEPLTACEVEMPELPGNERVILHVRRPSGRMIETEIGWGINCSDLQIRTDPAQSCIWVVNADTNQVVATRLLLSADGVTDEEPPLPSNGGFVLVNSLTGSGHAAAAGGGVRGILAGPVSRGCGTGCRRR
jgi:hypothetical protein